MGPLHFLGSCRSGENFVYRYGLLLILNRVTQICHVSNKHPFVLLGCTNQECFPPRIVDELSGRNKGLPAAAYVGISCIFLMLIAMAVAVVVVKVR